MADWCTRVRAVVLHPQRRQVLAVDGALPELVLPGRLWSGLPAQPVAALRDLTGLDTALLWRPEEHADEAAHVLAMTLVFVARGTPPSGHWVDPAELDEPWAVRAVDELTRGVLPAGRQPWRDRSWLPAAEDWIGRSLAALGRGAATGIEQVRVCELSSVLRVSTEDTAVYFKAVASSPLFVNEGPVLRELAGAFPEHIPAPLAVDASRRWMLLPDFGAVIGWTAPVEVREDALRTFARLQIRSADHVDRLLAAGLFDRRLDRLAARATDWLPALDLTRWLSAADAAAVRAAAPHLAVRCADLAALALPDTMVHGDLHLNNVARGEHGYVFFDWTDACVSHPFVDLIEIVTEESAADRDRLRDAYLAEWAGVAPADTLRRAWDLAVPLVSLHQAISYISLVLPLEQDPDPDELGAETGVWLRRVLAGL